MTNLDTTQWIAAIRDREALLGEESVKRMAEIFLEEVSTLLQRALMSTQTGNLDEARRVTHHLSGSAGALDLQELLSLALLSEQACLSGNQESALEAIKRTEKAALESANLLRKHFNLK